MSTSGTSRSRCSPRTRLPSEQLLQRRARPGPACAESSGEPAILRGPCGAGGQRIGHGRGLSCRCPREHRARSAPQPHPGVPAAFSPRQMPAHTRPDRRGAAPWRPCSGRSHVLTLPWKGCFLRTSESIAVSLLPHLGVCV